MSVEAVKTRIAANAPSADPEADIESLRFLAPSTTPSGHLQQWPAGKEFHLRDGAQVILVRVAIHLRNTSNRTTRFTLRGAPLQPSYNP